MEEEEDGRATQVARDRAEQEATATDPGIAATATTRGTATITGKEQDREPAQSGPKSTRPHLHLSVMPTRVTSS